MQNRYFSVFKSSYVNLHESTGRARKMLTSRKIQTETNLPKSPLQITGPVTMRRECEAGRRMETFIKLDK